MITTKNHSLSRLRLAINVGVIGIVLFSHPLFSAPFSNNGDGTVTDTATGLRWQRCSRGQANDSTCSGSVTSNSTWQQALAYCGSLTLGGFSWRLPSVTELFSLVDPSRTNPSIDTVFFPNTSTYLYWTSTTYQPNGSIYNAWGVSFSVAGIRYNTKGGLMDQSAVRCVTGP